MTLSVQNQKVRYHYLDVLKIIGILFVVLYHCGVESVFVGILSYISPIFSVCVAVFFFVNGALLLNKEIDMKKHVKKIYKLLFLLLFWGIIILLSKMIIQNNYLSLYDFLDALLYLKQPWVHYLWFFRALIIIYLLFPLFKSLYGIHRNYFYFITIFLLVLSVGSSAFSSLAILIESIFSKNIISEFLKIANDVLHFYGIDFVNFTYAIALFLMGGIFHSFRTKIKDFFLNKKLYQKVLIIIALSLTIVLSSACLKLYADEFFVIDVIWFGMGSVFTFVNVVCLALISLWLTSGMSEFFLSISKHTMSIFLVHCVIKEILFLLVKVLSIPSGALTAIILFILCFALSYLLGLLMNKNKYSRFFVTL